MTKKICISGYYGFDNFGDEAILKVLVEHLKNFKCNPQITVFSSNPEETSKQLNVKSVQTFNISAVLKELLKCDCLISGGGSLLQDKTCIKSLFYYLFVIFSAQLLGKETVIFAQGIGPISNKFASFITFLILKRCQFITVRDYNSMILLKDHKIYAKKCSDPVWSINIPKHEKTGKIGIQLREFSSVTDEFINYFAFCINKYYSKKEILILSLQNKLDLSVCYKFEQKLKQFNPNINAKVIENTSNKKVIDDIASLDELIAMRYHACLIAIKAGVKLLPINYDIKVESLARDFGLNYINIGEDIGQPLENFVNSNIVYDELKIKGLNYDFELLEEKICRKNN